MVLEPRKTTVGYRCPHCGTGVISVVGMLSLGADMLKLKCECGGSELSLVFSKDGNVRLSVPCILCPTPHTFTIRKSLFFEKDLFCLPCPYSDINICLIGDGNRVKAELSRTELELLQIFEENGIDSIAALQKLNEGECLPDPEIRSIVTFVIRELDADGKITCKCQSAPSDREYDVEVCTDHVRISCSTCGAERVIPTDSYLAAHAFLNCDELRLE